MPKDMNGCNMKEISTMIKPGIEQIIYKSESFPFKVKKVFDSITKMNWIYIIPLSGKEYAITEECADDIIKSMIKEKI